MSEQTLHGKRAVIERRRTWRERLLSWPWRPWWQWTEATPVMTVEGVHVDADTRVHFELGEADDA